MCGQAFHSVCVTRIPTRAHLEKEKLVSEPYKSEVVRAVQHEGLVLHDCHHPEIRLNG